MRVMYSGWSSSLVLGLVALFAAPAGGAPQQPQSAEAIVLKLVERAERHRARPNPVYYICTKQTVSEELDSKGRVRARKVRVGESRAHPKGAHDADKWGSKNGISINAELLQRYQFSFVRREMFNGRPTFRLNFVPKDPAPPVRQLQDRVLNRVEGTVWIDAEEYELVKAAFHVSEPVSFGILGAVEALRFSFQRFRGQDGGWLTLWTDMQFKGRKFLKSVQTRKRVDWTDFKRCEESAVGPSTLGGG